MLGFGHGSRVKVAGQRTEIAALATRVNHSGHNPATSGGVRGGFSAAVINFGTATTESPFALPVVATT
ncbi:hypothetical protein D2E49_21200 [Mycobacteroides abscessus]|nr:hypothetical protein DDT53_21880 [Mycobacteroides abscessus]QCO24567.1 hypothetical protein CFE69_00260 [Mycobacteroides abscessus subsp. massiliense]AWG61394.1 hypothetical protein DDT47_21885 [Mycobacteroides abscessus]PVB03423.1 hypothetical protein DDJ51_14610 [Mycobacteroides abscessus]RIS14422.1 hypothetical protein D2E49_21200 [Mycobacteroides abscessus]